MIGINVNCIYNTRGVDCDVKTSKIHMAPAKCILYPPWPLTKCEFQQENSRPTKPEPIRINR